jgi:hypothetical protein
MIVVAVVVIAAPAAVAAATAATAAAVVLAAVSAAVAPARTAPVSWRNCNVAIGGLPRLLGSLDADGTLAPFNSGFSCQKKWVVFLTNQLG